MTSNTPAIVKQIDHLQRLTSSHYGNPRFRVHFTDGTSAITQSDAAFCYGLENRANLTGDVLVTFTRAGKIADLRPVSEATS